MFKNLRELLSFCDENEIKMADFMMVDINGRWRHLTMPIQRLTEDTLKYGVGFDGSNYGFAAVEKSDMVFVPDIKTAYIDQFAEIPTIAMIGDVFVIDQVNENYPFDQDPRSVAHAAIKYLKKTGIADEFRIGPEFEFHVLDSVSYNVSPNENFFRIDCEEACWNTKEEPNQGYRMPHKGGYHMTAPMDRFSDFRSEVCIMMEEQGIAVKYHHHEVGGPGQLEVEVELGGLVDMCDNTMKTKNIIKNLAMQYGKTATFMPKPMHGEAGNGLHVHMLLYKDGKPLFYDANGYSQLSETALHFIGGLLKHAKALCAITNPSTNSYKRLVPGYEAPVTIGYATANRSAVVRIPAYAKSPETKRFELRNPDATCNPYYAYSAILMAGIDGVINKIDPEKSGYGPYDFNLYNLSKEEQAKIKSLPRSLDEALDALRADHDFLLAGGVFPKSLIDLWIDMKAAEAAKFNQIPHPAEYDMYYSL